MTQRSVPSIVWVIAIILGIVAFLALIFGAFYGFTQIEGLGSLVLLVLGWVVIRSISPRAAKQPARPQQKPESIAVAFGVLMFAFAGFALDQPGNVIYNLPIQWLFCPANTQLTREADVSRPRAGTTVITQDFTCVDADSVTVTPVPIWGAMVVRFVEYLVLGYLLIWLNQLYMRIRAVRAAA